uniref:EF-hand domain-containing protein n=1 Tax=Setaria digitata TaxID=48799 RepID=A0A915PCF8_9BILA
MVDILLEEDENSLNFTPAFQNADFLLEEQARKMFLLCDHNRKGFVVKMDLVRIDGMIPNISQQQLEAFFDNADVFRTNYITENQFIEHIKPILLQNVVNEAYPREIKEREKEKGLHSRKSDENEKKRMRKEVQEDAMDSEQKVLDPSKYVSSGTATELEKALGIKKPSKTTGQLMQRNSEQDDRMPSRKSQEIHDSARSLRDKLVVAAIGTGHNWPHRVESLTKRPFTIENRGSPVLYDSQTQTTVEIKQNFKLNDLRKRDKEIRSQLDLCKNRYYSEVKSSSRSLADELRECGIINNEPSSEQRLEYSPDRIFKVVFVGDSAVGKTCFLHRFCHNRFKPLFNATIGVDFTVKTIQLRNRVVAVQLWDTAGQERFRSITKQYFRKADGVILMYDVTSEQSFLNVRNWIASVKAGVDESCVMCLVGNKIDLFANDYSRVLKYKYGQKIAEEFGMMFFETSAFTGFGINDCMRAVAMKLQEREDEQWDDVLKLDISIQQSKQKSWCCV